MGRPSLANGLPGALSSVPGAVNDRRHAANGTSARAAEAAREFLSRASAAVAWIDRWIERANQKEASMGGRLDEERRRRREELSREQAELADLNTRWAKL